MFKVGDEVYVKAQVVDTDVKAFEGYNHKVQFLDSINNEWDWVSESAISDKTYTQGLADAWELAKKIYCMTCTQVEKIFDVEGGFWDVIRDFTYEEALAKISEYEREKEIKVGDVVGSCGVYGVVARKEKENLYVMWSDGSCGIDINPESLYKTGKHIDIESLLRQIGE